MARFDMFRDVHKGIRFAVFTFVNELGNSDLSSNQALGRLRVALDELVDLLESHARHEDAHITPVLAKVDPGLAEWIESDHHAYDARLASCRRAFVAVEHGTGDIRAERAHELYLDLSLLAAEYLLHMDREERDVNRALWNAFDDEHLIRIHQALLAGIEPAEKMASLGWILRASNVDTRSRLLDGVRTQAPRAVFEGIMATARAVLSPLDMRDLAFRLDELEEAAPSSRAA